MHHRLRDRVNARTKPACILNYVLASHLKDELVLSMKKMPYSLSVDGSNDTGLSNFDCKNL